MSGFYSHANFGSVVGQSSYLRWVGSVLCTVPSVINWHVVLGAATVNAPRSELEIKRNMTILNDHNSEAIPISLMIPNSSDGVVR